MENIREGSRIARSSTEVKRRLLINLSSCIYDHFLSLDNLSSILFRRGEFLLRPNANLLENLGTVSRSLGNEQRDVSPKVSNLFKIEILMREIDYWSTVEIKLIKFDIYWFKVRKVEANRGHLRFGYQQVHDDREQRSDTGNGDDRALPRRERRSIEGRHYRRVLGLATENNWRFVPSNAKYGEPCLSLHSWEFEEVSIII